MGGPGGTVTSFHWFLGRPGRWLLSPSCPSCRSIYSETISLNTLAETPNPSKLQIGFILNFFSGWTTLIFLSLASQVSSSYPFLSASSSEKARNWDSTSLWGWGYKEVYPLPSLALCKWPVSQQIKKGLREGGFSGGRASVLGLLHLYQSHTSPCHHSHSTHRTFPPVSMEMDLTLMEREYMFQSPHLISKIIWLQIISLYHHKLPS